MVCYNQVDALTTDYLKGNLPPRAWNTVCPMSSSVGTGITITTAVGKPIRNGP
jgi:hypothetical protein